MNTLLVTFAAIILILLWLYITYNEEDSDQYKIKKIFLEAGVLNPIHFVLKEYQHKEILRLQKIKNNLLEKSTMGISQEKNLEKSGFKILEYPSDYNLQIVKAKTYTNRNLDGFIYCYSFITKKTLCYKLSNDRKSVYPEYTLNGTNCITIDLVLICEGIFAKQE